jgi:hypothetical protein
MGIQLEGTRDPQAAADRAALTGFPTRAQVQQALQACEDDLATLAGGLTLAKAGPILQRVVQNQRTILRALAVLVRQVAG